MNDIKKGINKFYIGDDEENPLAQIILADTERAIIKIEHTYVSEELKGQGIGSQLVKAVVDFAREENKKIIPSCTFAQTEFKKNEKYRDVLFNLMP